MLESNVILQKEIDGEGLTRFVLYQNNTRSGFETCYCGLTGVCFHSRRLTAQARLGA